MSEAQDGRMAGHEEHPRMGRRSWGPRADEPDQDTRPLQVAARAATALHDAGADDSARRPANPRPTAITRSRPEPQHGARAAGQQAQRGLVHRVRVAARDQATAARAAIASPTTAAGRPASLRADRFSAGDLIEQLTPEIRPRSTRGWRARFGMAPGRQELAEIRDAAAAKTLFQRPVTIMVANPKGGSGKTPTSMLLAAALGHARGGGVVAWDNNELRGTLPDRSESRHRRNVHDVLKALEQLRWSNSSFTDLAYFLNHQSTGNFFTLGSAQSSGQVVTGQNFRQVHELFCRYFQVIVVDTGNNEAAPNWRAAAGEADCLVVPTKWRTDSLIPAARMLESLQDTHPGLLGRTVIAATNGPMDAQQEVKDKSASWFGSSHPIVDIPVDPHIAEGGVMDWTRLRTPTKRAALRLAAEVASRLIEGGHRLDP